MEYVDVLIVGAGLSGIGAAWHVTHRCKNKSFAILEARHAIGGTWDLFRYPGIRSDSDMHTLGYRFKPWTKAKAIADGTSIREYVNETARENGIDRHIRFGHKMTSASWSSDEARWTVTSTLDDGASVSIQSQYLMMCSGYYSYDQGHRPDFPGEEAFKGTFIHPQHWPEDLDYAGKNITVIGSGATAVTLIPVLAEKAAKVTMLQRSPTYYFDRPAEDKLANRLRKWLPDSVAYGLTRFKNVSLQQFAYRFTRKQPAKAKERMIGLVQAAMGPDYDVSKHFTPTYGVWDQRVCLVPDSDLFLSLKSGKADIVTDTIATFTEGGIRTTNGTEIAADIVVTATGLKLNVLGDAKFSVDGKAIELGKSVIYKGMMLGDVPNLTFVFGYTNASWTLKADLTSEFFCRLVNHADKLGTQIATPVPIPGMETEPFLDFSSGYVQRALDKLPKQGTVAPWKLHQNYGRDLVTLRFGKLEDGTMRFSRATQRAQAA